MLTEEGFNFPIVYANNIIILFHNSFSVYENLTLKNNNRCTVATLYEICKC